MCQQLTAERASLSAGTEQARAEHDTFATCIHEREVTAATRDEELDVVVQGELYLKSLIAAGEYRPSTAGDRAHETLNKISELQALVERRNRTVGGKHAGVAELVDAELIPVWLDITAA